MEERERRRKQSCLLKIDMLDALQFAAVDLTIHPGLGENNLLFIATNNMADDDSEGFQSYKLRYMRTQVPVCD